MDFIVCTILAGIAAAALALAVLKFIEQQRVLDLAGANLSLKGISPLLVVFLPLGRRMAPLGARIIGQTRCARIDSRLTSAGVGDVIDAPTFVGARLAAALFFCFAFILSMPSRPVASAAAGFAFGWCYIVVWLRTRVRSRRDAIEIALPGAIDWLSLSVEAGLDFAQALGRVSLRLRKGPLKEELTRLDSAMRMGTPRATAFAAMAERACVPAISSLSALLIQADRLGTSIGPVLRTVADRLRAERFARAERHGIAAAQKALLPLALCIMPATFVVVFGPLFVRLVTGGFDALF